MPESVAYDMDALDLLIEWEERQKAGTPITPEELCGDDPTHLQTLRGYIARVSKLAPVLALAETPPVELRELPGYELLGELGRGGMGIVYKAKDTQLKRLVAIKVPCAGLRSQARFSREGEALAALQHENIVPVYAAGLHDGTPYIVMAYIDGHNLRDRMPTTATPLPVLVEFFAQIADALSHAHQHGIIHRDLKPANILCQANNTLLGKPVVSDFGVVALQAGEPVAPYADFVQGETIQNEPRLTRTDYILGTPAYAAPEMQGPQHAPATPATDVWSLGVVLYECLTGQLPYPSVNLRPALRFAEPLVPLAMLRKGVPRSLAAIVRKCLALEPQGRYASAKEVGTALRGWLAQQRRRQRVKRGVGWAAALLFVATLVASLAWPKSRAEQHAEALQQRYHQLEDTGFVELVPAKGGPTAPFARVNAAQTKMQVQDGTFVVEAMERPGLVELLHDVPFDRYRITAELRQMAARQHGLCGLYFHYHSDSPEEGHRFTHLQFSDMGASTQQYPGPNGQYGSALTLRCLRYKSPDVDGQPMFSNVPLAWIWYQAPPITPAYPHGPWRTMRVTVTPEAHMGELDDIVVRPHSPHPTVTELGRRVPSPAMPRGGLGLYVYDSRMQVRNVTVERLP